MAHIWHEMDTMQIQIAHDSYKCSICDNISTSPIQLTVHCIVLHGLLPCMHCLKLFGSEQLLNEHTRKQHAQCTYSCSECHGVFQMEKDLCFHMTRIHFKKQCPLCVAKIVYDDFQNHLEKLHKITNTTTVAAAIVAENIISFGQFSVVLENRSQFHCHLCQDKKCMSRLEKLISHFLYFHKLSLPSLLRCIFADSTSYGELQLMNAADNGDDDDSPFVNKCDRCDLAYSWSIPRIFHQIYCHGSVYCAICRNCLQNDQIFDEHLKNCECRNGEQLPAIKLCDDDHDVCDIKDVTHLKNAHNFSENYEFSSAKTSLMNTQNECNFCGEHLNKSGRALNLDGLIKHFRLVHRFNAAAILRWLNKQNDDVKMDAAEKCQSSSKVSKRENSKLEPFILVEHELDESRIEHRMDLAANIVRYVYSSESDYDSIDSDDDNRTIHSRTALDRVYRCELCGCRSKSKYIFIIHMHQKHGFQIKTPEFRCNICRKHLKSVHLLKKHNLKFHHKQGHEKRFKCAFCAYGCNAKSRMR